MILYPNDASNHNPHNIHSLQYHYKQWEDCESLLYPYFEVLPHYRGVKFNIIQLYFNQ